VRKKFPAWLRLSYSRLRPCDCNSELQCESSCVAGAQTHSAEAPLNRVHALPFLGWRVRLLLSFSADRGWVVQRSATCGCAGYEHPVDQVVEDLLSCLDDPALALLQWNEAFGVVQVRDV
jgi:hypothetical protein